MPEAPVHSASDGAILTLNAGSSSLKVGVFDADLGLIATALADRIGAQQASLRLRHGGGDAMALPKGLTDDPACLADHGHALGAILSALAADLPRLRVAAVGHRVVHGGPVFDRHTRIDEGVIIRIEALAPFAPLHQPHNLAGIRAAIAAFPKAVQVACFDTAFHRSHDFINDTFGLPRAWYERGLRRYGFHGLSYDHIACRLGELAPKLARGRVIVAHLGSGASICGLADGRSVSSTMGFSALDGLPMGTRCGQIDPGVLLYLLEQEGMSPADLSDLLYRHSGLLGLSGLSNDMRTLEASDLPAAHEAIAYFTARIRREIGGLAAALGGVDAVVFCGGIGENSARVRAEVIAPMGWLGLGIDAARNAQSALVISPEGAGVPVMVIPTDEERVIARATRDLAGLDD